MKAFLEPFWGSLQRLFGDRRLIKVARWTGILLTVLSTAVVIRQAASQLASGLPASTLPGILLAFGSYGISFGVQGAAWCLLIGGLSHARTGWRDLEIWAYSSLMRRTPGVVWYLIERVESYREGGLAAGVTLTAAGAEWALLLAASAVVFLLTGPELTAHSLPIVGAAFVFGGLFSWRVLRRWVRMVSGQATSGGQLSLVQRVSSAWAELGLAFVLYAGCYLLGGVIILQLVRIVDPGSRLILQQAANLWAATGGIALFASMVIPVNVGVREITVAVALLPFTTADAAITVAAMIRVLFVTADVIFGVAFWQASRWLRLRGSKGLDAVT